MNEPFSMMSSTSRFSIPLLVSRSSPAAASADGRALGEPVRVGLPVARGDYDGRDRLVVAGPDGQPLPTQTRVLDRWSDGSVRWLLVDFVAGTSDRDWQGELRPLDRARETDPTAASPLTVDAAGSTVTVQVGAATFTCRAGGPLPCAPTDPNGQTWPIDASRTALDIRDLNGGRGTFLAKDVTVEDSGPLRTTVRVAGQVDGLTHPLMVEARVTWFAGSPIVRLDLTVRNPSAAKHPGGCWDLGDPGSIQLERLSLSLPFAPGFAPKTCYSAEPEQPYAAVSGPLEIYQDSSGGEAWHTAIHLNRHRTIATRFRGYTVRQGDAVQGDPLQGNAVQQVPGAPSRDAQTTPTDLRATPIVSLRGSMGELCAAITNFWQTFPKAIDVSAEALHLHLFPPQTEGGHELQAGEQKTHTLFLSFATAADAAISSTLEWTRAPAFCRSTPDYYATTAALPYLTPLSTERDAAYVDLVQSAIEGPESFEQKRERLDSYGWRHFGDVYGDHEAAFHPGPGLLVSHWNNQYDTIAGAARQFLRSGDPRWWRMMVDMAAHVADIDVYHTDQDKSAYNHGLFWHTAHYVDADVATHRTYPSQARVSSGEHSYESQTKIIGGGPACGHLYATGLAVAYFLTGNDVARHAAIELANYVISCDDGSRTIFKWLDRGYTGHATGSGWDNYHGPGRGSANAVNTLLDGYWLTGEARFLEKAEQLIRRCIHPTEDVTRNRLDDVENRWFYTMFLQVLGRYLDVKAEAGQIDRMYRYARASLLHYARWMAAHARPFLDKPEQLEFPTETWAAQDVRKADIFLHAARHAADPAERARFLERADWFFRYVVDTLSTMPTKTFCRPVAILMGSGFMRNWFALHPREATPPVGDVQEDYGPPTVFVAQKVRAIKRAKLIVAAGGAVTVALIGYLGLLLFT